MSHKFPPNVEAEVQRILDGAARRMLAEQLAGDADTAQSHASTRRPRRRPRDSPEQPVLRASEPSQARTRDVAVAAKQ